MYTFIPLDNSIQLQTFSALKDLQSFVDNSRNQVIPYLNHINTLLQQAVSTCKAAVQTSEQLQDLGEKENIPPQKSLEHQWRFMKTCKSPSRKKNGNILRCAIHSSQYNNKTIYVGMLIVKKRQRSLTSLKMRYYYICMHRTDHYHYWVMWSIWDPFSFNCKRGLKQSVNVWTRPSIKKTRSRLAQNLACIKNTFAYIHSGIHVLYVALHIPYSVKN